jgi:hypothetical protein
MKLEEIIVWLVIISIISVVISKLTIDAIMILIILMIYVFVNNSNKAQEKIY